MTEKKKSAGKEEAEKIDGPVKQVKKVKAKELLADEELESLDSEQIIDPVAETEEETESEEAASDIITAETYGFEPEAKKEKKAVNQRGRSGAGSRR